MIIAIDPGLIGAMTLLDGEYLAEVESLLINDRDTQKRVDGLRIRQILVEWAAHSIIIRLLLKEFRQD